MISGEKPVMRNVTAERAGQGKVGEKVGALTRTH